MSNAESGSMKTPFESHIYDPGKDVLELGEKLRQLLTEIRVSDCATSAVGRMIYLSALDFFWNEHHEFSRRFGESASVWFFPTLAAKHLINFLQNGLIQHPEDRHFWHIYDSYWAWPSKPDFVARPAPLIQGTRLMRVAEAMPQYFLDRKDFDVEFGFHSSAVNLYGQQPSGAWIHINVDYVAVEHYLSEMYAPHRPRGTWITSFRQTGNSDDPSGFAYEIHIEGVLVDRYHLILEQAAREMFDGAIRVGNVLELDFAGIDDHETLRLWRSWRTEHALNTGLGLNPLHAAANGELTLPGRQPEPL